MFSYLIYKHHPCLVTVDRITLCTPSLSSIWTLLVLNATRFHVTVYAFSCLSMILLIIPFTSSHRTYKVDLCVDKTGRISFMRPDPKKQNGPDSKGPPGKSRREEKLKNAYKKELSNGQLISIMMENIIRRKVSYSTILLSDLMKRQITPSFAIIMLRVVMLFLKGLCAPLMLNSNTEESRGANMDVDMDVDTDAEGAVNSSSRKKRRVLRGGSVNDLVTVFKCVSPHTGGLWNSYSDDHVQGAITWAEALLDAHFSSLAFRASQHAPTRQALGNVMETSKPCCSMRRNYSELRDDLTFFVVRS